MKVQLICISLVVLCMLGQLLAKEPLRVGTDVPEPKLIKKVDIAYPDEARTGIIGGPVVLDILIDEQGAVAEAKERNFTPALLDAAKSAVKKWVFSPTFVDGKAVAVAATVVVDFSLGRTPYTVDLSVRGWTLPNPPGNLCFTRVIMDRHGSLSELPNNIHIIANATDGTDAPFDLGCTPNNKYRLLIPDSDVPFSLVEAKMKGQSSPLRDQLLAPQFRFPDFVQHGRPGVRQLYYSALLVSSGSQLVQLAGVDPDVHSPQLDIDFNRLAGNIEVSKYKSGAVFFYTVFVDENGTILGIEAGDNSGKAAAIIESLSKVRVITPGFRNGVPIPTAVILALRVP